jgi:hypothetical protein
MPIAPVDPAALKNYVPGAMSRVYQKYSNDKRQKIAQRTDEIFKLKTGFDGKIDDKKPEHRPFMRQWLIIRDMVVLKDLFDTMTQEIRKGEAQRLEKELAEELEEARKDDVALRKRLSREAEERGLPPELPHGLGGKLWKLGGMIVDISHVAHLFEVEVLAGAGAVGGGILMGVGGLVSLLALLHEIGEAHEIGDNQAERRAFLHGFASFLVHGEIKNGLGANDNLGRKQLQGELAAKEMLRGVPEKTRNRFLEFYRGPQRWPNENMDRALRDLGYR